MIISVLSNTQGVGKTTTATTLGHALVRSGYRVLVVDLDPQCAATAILLQEPPEYNIKNILTDIDVPIEECVAWVSYQRNLYCIANTPSTAAIEPLLIDLVRNSSAYDVLKTTLRDYAQEKFDFTLLDCPSNQGIFVINALHASDFAIIPIVPRCRHSSVALSCAVQLIQGVQRTGQSNLQDFRFLINKIDRRISEDQVGVEQLMAQFDTDRFFNTVISINNPIRKAAIAKSTVIRYDARVTGTKAYRALAKEFLSIVDGSNEEKQAL